MLPGSGPEHILPSRSSGNRSLDCTSTLPVPFLRHTSHARVRYSMRIDSEKVISQDSGLIGRRFESGLLIGLVPFVLR